MPLSAVIINPEVDRPRLVQQHKLYQELGSPHLPLHQPSHVVLDASGLKYGRCSLNKPDVLPPTKFAFAFPLLESPSAPPEICSNVTFLVKALKLQLLPSHPNHLGTPRLPSLLYFSQPHYHHLTCNVFFLFSVFFSPP